LKINLAQKIIVFFFIYNEYYNIIILYYLYYNNITSSENQKVDFGRKHVRPVSLLNYNTATGTKEQSFVYALSSAALTYTMTRDCASGMLPSCGCGTHPEDTDGTFKWSGCDDNVRWGAKFARQFVKNENPLASDEYNGDGDDDLSANANEDAVRREQRAMSIVDEHNYKIGRKVRH